MSSNNERLEMPYNHSTLKFDFTNITIHSKARNYYVKPVYSDKSENNLLHESMIMDISICHTRYSIEDLMGDAKYMVNMKVEVCLEKDKPCILSQDIVKDLYLPKIGCDWSLDFSSKLFKLTLYYFFGNRISIISSM